MFYDNFFWIPHQVRDDSAVCRMTMDDAAPHNTEFQNALGIDAI